MKLTYNTFKGNLKETIYESVDLIGFSFEVR